MAEPQRIVAEPLADGVGERELQLTAMDRDLRPLVARLAAARLAPDRLAEAVEVRERRRRDALALDAVREAELGELAHRVRQQVDADAEGAQLADAVVDPDVALADRVKAQRCGETADAGADDDDPQG